LLTISLPQGHGLNGDLWFGRRCSGLVFPIELESLAMPTEERLWPNDEKRLLPCPNHLGQKYQEHPIRFGTRGSFHVSAKDNERLSEECVFCHEFGLASRKVSHRSQDERGVGWFCPVGKVVMERLKAESYQLLNEGDNTMHDVRFPF
jgi:hypothetical protein